jgi:hypothetical protein
LYPTAGLFRPHPFQGLGQSLAPAPLERVVRAGRQGLKLPQQFQPVYQEGLAGLPAAEVLHQLDGPASAHTKDLLEDRTIDHRHRERRQLLLDLGKSK